MSASCDIYQLTPSSASVPPLVVPSLEIVRLAPVSTVLATAATSFLDVNIALLLTLRAPAFGHLTAANLVQLDAGDLIAVRYNADGYTGQVNLIPCTFSAIAFG